MSNSEKTDPVLKIVSYYVYNVKMVCGIQNRNVTEACTPADPNSAGNPVLSPGIYSTEVNIFNFHDEMKAQVSKYFVPLVIENRTIGLEPEQQKATPLASIVLEPNSATMDDCCIISQSLKGKNLLSVGFLKIVSNISLAVTAVYTVSDLENRVVGIEVEQINEMTDRLIL